MKNENANGYVFDAEQFFEGTTGLASKRDLFASGTRNDLTRLKPSTGYFKP